MRKYKDQQQSFLSITASKSAAPHNLFVNKSLYGLCSSRKQACRLHRHTQRKRYFLCSASMRASKLEVSYLPPPSACTSA
jgi:hypothetical protein